MENQDKRRLNDEQTILDPETARIPVPMDEKQQGKAEAQGAKKNKKTGASNAIYGAAGGVVGAAAGIGGSQLFGQGPDEPIEESEESPTQGGHETQHGATEPGTAGTFMGEEIDIAHVDDDMSFSEAFAAAREQVGPGGVFEWHGGVYGTYYANEWNAMTDEQHEQWYSSVDYQAARENPEPELESEPNPEPNPEQEVHITADDIHEGFDVIEVGDVELPDGSTAGVAHVDVDGEQVVLVDFDQDNIADVALHDANADSDFFNDEPIDLTNENITMPTSHDEPVALDDPNVVLIDVETDVEIDGNTVDVATIDLEGGVAFMVDANQDGEANFIVPDVNQNSQLDTEDIEVASAADVIIDVTDQGMAMPEPIDVVDDSAIAMNDDMEMDDYINDANVDDFIA